MSGITCDDENHLFVHNFVTFYMLFAAWRPGGLLEGKPSWAYLEWKPSWNKGKPSRAYLEWKPSWNKGKPSWAYLEGLQWDKQHLRLKLRQRELAKLRVEKHLLFERSQRSDLTCIRVRPWLPIKQVSHSPTW
jgi:hypothetical protein